MSKHSDKALPGTSINQHAEHSDMTVDGSSSTVATEHDLTDPDLDDYHDDSSDVSDGLSIPGVRPFLANALPPAALSWNFQTLPPFNARPPPPPAHKPAAVRTVTTDLARPRPYHARFDDSIRPKPPQRSDSPAAPSAEEAALRQRLATQYVELKGARCGVFDTIDRAQANRAHIQNLRHVKDETERRFMAAIEPALSGHPLARQLLKSMRDARLECQEAESRFDEVLDELQHNHEGVESQERRFYLTAIGATEPPLVRTRHGQDTVSEESLLLRGISGDRPEMYHPLHEKLRAAFGELQLAKELLANTRMKREALLLRRSQPLSSDGLSFLETYGDAGRKKALELKELTLITDEDREQLQIYSDLEQTAVDDIDSYTAKVEQLRAECREKRVLPEDSIFHEDILKMGSLQDDIRLGPIPFDSDEFGTLSHPVFPLLLSNPTHLLDDFPRTALQSLRAATSLPSHAPHKHQRVNDAAREVNMHRLLATTNSEDKDDFVNHWLLHKLHQSAMEAELLWTTFRTRLKILDIDRWQRDVLKFWWRDEKDSTDSVISDDDDTGHPVLSTDVKVGELEMRSESGKSLRRYRAEDWP